MGNCPRRRPANASRRGQSCTPGTAAPPVPAGVQHSEPPVRRWPHLIKNIPVSECRTPGNAEIYCALERQNQLLSRICELLTQLTDRPDSTSGT